MVLCACFRAPSARYEENEAPVPQIIIHDLDVAKQASDAAASPRHAGKACVDQSSTRDTHAEVDKATIKAMPSPQPVLDAQTSIWEKLASHEICNLSPTPEPKEMTPAPEACAAEASTEACKTPDLTITGTSIKPVTAPAAAGVKPVSAKKPWGARAAPSSGGADPTTPPSSRRTSSSGGARKSAAGTPPSAGVAASLLKPTAASAARAQATVKPKSDEAVWKC